MSFFNQISGISTTNASAFEAASLETEGDFSAVDFCVGADSNDIGDFCEIDGNGYKEFGGNGFEEIAGNGFDEIGGNGYDVEDAYAQAMLNDYLADYDSDSESDDDITGFIDEG